MFKLNHPRIALFQLHHFSWNPYCWWRHHLWMTSLLPFWWRHVTWSHFIWCNFGPSMILPSFITNGSFLEILRQNSWILGVFDSSYQGLLLEGPMRGWLHSGDKLCSAGDISWVWALLITIRHFRNDLEGREGLSEVEKLREGAPSLRSF